MPVLLSVFNYAKGKIFWVMLELQKIGDIQPGRNNKTELL